MLSLSEWRRDMFKTFAMMRDKRMTIEISHRRKIYAIHVEDTGRRVETPYNIKKSRKTPPVLNALIESEPCKECGSLLVNGIHMARGCVNS